MDSMIEKQGFNKQLNLALSLCIIFLSLVSSTFVSYVTYQRERNAYIEYGENITNSFINHLSTPFSGSFEEFLGYTATSFFKLPEVQKIIVFDDEFTPLFSTQKKLDYESIVGWQDINSVKARFERETDQAFYFTARLETSYKGAGTAYLMLVFKKPGLGAYVEAIFFTNAGIIVFVSLISLLTLGIVIRRVTRPLEEFSSMMIQAASGETGLRIDHQASAELSKMSEAFNQMMEMGEQRLEELESSRDRAVQVAKIKSDFAANVSHEIRTPLNGILGMVNLLKEMGLPQHQHEYLDVASKSGDSLLQMLNDVLDYSKVEGGHFELDIKDLDLRLLLEQLALLYAEKVQAKDLELCLDLPTSELLFVRADSTRIRQVISNLLNNAVKFTASGHITLAAQILSNTNGRALIEISVADTGMGIPEQALGQIFMPFIQVDAKTSNEFGGTGLGLTIVSQMAELMGGEVSVSSVEGEGSCFKLILPMQAHDIELDVPRSEAALLEGKTILLVEPFAETQRYLEGMFKCWGLFYQTVDSLEEAAVAMKLDAHTSGTPDVCLFNVDYSGGSMSDFLTGFKSNTRYKDTKLIPMVRFGSKTTSMDEGGLTFVASIDRPVRYEKLRMTLLEVFSDKDEPIRRKNETGLNKKYSEVLQNKTVLVVDDNDTNQLVAMAMLNEIGMTADLSSNGRDALNNFKRRYYDVVLMDCNMPVMDGYQATEAIRSLDFAGKEPLILALTAKTQRADVEHCLQSGMDGVLFKPFTLAALLAELEKAFGVPTASEDEAAINIDTPGADGAIIVDAVFDDLVMNTGDGIEQIVNTYLIDSPIYIITLVAAMEAGDTTKCLDLAHKIKGSSRNMGAEDLVSVCSEIERAWSQNTQDEALLISLTASLESEFSLVESVLTTKLETIKVASNGQAQRSKEIVLIVDDDQSTRMTVASVLEREGYMVEQGSNGREAVRLFDVLRPNVIIMDAMMPIKNGFEACSEIKSMPGGESVPILITTALESEKSVDLAFESGAADFVPKPINLSVLRQRVKRLLAKQAADKHVQKLAYKDSLTGLPNRVAFVEQFQQELEHAKRHGRRTAIFFIDLDRFKNINDSFGHFVVVLSDMNNKDTPEQVAKSMLEALNEPFNVAGQEVFASVSIGIAMYPDDGLSKDSLLKNADTAMYRAKAAGRNTYRRYTQDMSEVLEQRMRVETELRKVLVDNELSLYYQPKQDVLSGEIIGSEALVRWQHRLRGMVSPAEFIPVAEEMGLIKEIGLWVLNNACETLKRWQIEHAYQGTVAVNVSAVQMAEDNFVELVAECLHKHDLEPQYLELEVTETMVLNNIDAMLEMLNRIKKMGVSISIDDFGTGYSSFSYIKQLPADTLKLDMEFIQDIPASEEDMAVVDGMIVLAHNLGMKVVSEGVETQQQYDFLAKHKCDLIQGYLISKPLTEKAFEREYVALANNSEKSPVMENNQISGR